MSTAIDLKAIRKKILYYFFQDGLLDILFGAIMLIFGIIIMLTNLLKLPDWLIGAILPLIVIAFYVSKKFITKPRIGRFKLGLDVKVTIFLILSLIVFTISAIGILPAKLIIKGTTIPAFDWILIFIVMFSLAAAFLNIKRLYIYGVLYAVSLPFYKIFKHHVNLGKISLIMFFISAIIMLAAGIVVLIRFLHNYPIPSEEELGHVKK
jgi:hypothetical protein